MRILLGFILALSVSVNANDHLRQYLDEEALDHDWMYVRANNPMSDFPSHNIMKEAGHPAFSAQKAIPVFNASCAGGVFMVRIFWKTRMEINRKDDTVEITTRVDKEKVNKEFWMPDVSDSTIYLNDTTGFLKSLEGKEKLHLSSANATGNDGYTYINLLGFDQALKKLTTECGIDNF